VLTSHGPLPTEDAPAWEWLLFEQAGVVTTRQAVAHLGRPRVRHLVARGRWRSICRGILVTEAGRLTWAQQLWVAVLAAGPGAVLAGVAAAIEGGLRHLRPTRVDVLVPAGHGYADLLRRLPPDLPAVFVHRTAMLPDDHVRPGLPNRTSMGRSIVDAASWARSDEEARTIIAMGCQQRLVAPDDLLNVVAVLPRARRRRLVMETAHDIAGGAQALAEIDLIRLCGRFGLPRPELQERRTDTAGRVRYLDAYWRRWRLHAEVDGAHHMDARHWEADLRRQNDVWIRGDRILRFTAFQVRHRPHEVAAQLRRALEAAGWRASLADQEEFGSL